MRISDNSYDLNNLNTKETKKTPIIFLILLAGLGFSVYFTGTKLIPSIGNNIGPFEVISAVIFLISFLYFVKHRLQVQFHPVVKLLYCLLVIAIMSLPNLVDRIDLGILQLLLLAYTLIIVLMLHNILIQFPSLLKIFLGFVVIGAAVAGLWIFIEGVSSGSRVATGGPFRNRTHVGIYMLTSFWLTLLYFFWPGISKRNRFLTFFAILLTLYGVAISGRRSVYLSLIIGLALLAFSMVILKGKDKFRISLASLIIVIGLGGFMLFGSQYLPQLDFFRERVKQIDDRLELATGADDETADEDNFILLQRQGMFNGLEDHPILGIGWGGFHNSEYSPTGHEMHSTPQRFLVELGVIGFVFYMLYNFYLWFGSMQLFYQVRTTKYQMPALLFMVAIWSLSISWVYNRNVTERTYWILIILFISFETLIRTELAKHQKSALMKKIQRSVPFPNHPGRGQPHSPPITPLSNK